MTSSFNNFIIGFQCHDPYSCQTSRIATWSRFFFVTIRAMCFLLVKNLLGGMRITLDVIVFEKFSCDTSLSFRSMSSRARHTMSRRVALMTPSSTRSGWGASARVIRETDVSWLVSPLLRTGAPELSVSLLSHCGMA